MKHLIATAKDIRPVGQEGRTSVLTSKHATDLEHKASMVRNENESGLYCLGYEITGVWK